jgi:isoleucyl-tRNA synthetase
MSVDPGWSFAEDGHAVVALDTRVTPELAERARVFDLTHAVNVLRKERGLEVSDRIRLEIPAADSDLLERYRERIAEETLAVEIEVGGSLDLRKV